MRRWRSSHTFFFADLGSGGVIFFNVSMGHRLPRSLGYRSQLGMAFIPIVGGGGAAVIDEINNESLLAKHTHDAGSWHRGQGMQVEGRQMPGDGFLLVGAGNAPLMEFGPPCPPPAAPLSRSQDHCGQRPPAGAFQPLGRVVAQSHANDGTSSSSIRDPRGGGRHLDCQHHCCL